MNNKFNSLLPVLLSIPKNEFETITYLDIIDGQEKENIISKIYAFYLDVNKNPIISSWFVKSIMELISEKRKEPYFELTDYEVYTEYPSLNNQGRIDIVLLSDKQECSIIIENKINHILNNNLINYWETFEHSKYANKKGVLLTLEDTKVSDENFTPIKHIDWIKKVESKIDWEKLSERHIIQLQDFIINIKFISKNYVMNEQVKFYSDYFNQIDSLISIREQAYSYVNNIVKSIADSYGWAVYGSTHELKQIWNKIDDERVFFALFPNQILKEKKLIIKIQIDGYATDYYDFLKNEMQNLMANSDYSNIKLSNKTNDHFLGEIEVIDLDELKFENLSKIISDLVQKLNPLRQEIYKILKTKMEQQKA
ncbi:MAG: PD-(D/E)XK nuclease family protein [Flavobacteriales bacterium]|nr:PD-(D/E)XK nuclease family protein [Flavobacteriales bacterium]